MARNPLTRQPWLKWVLSLGFWTVLGLAAAVQLFLSRYKLGAPVSWGFAVGRSLADWYGFAVLSIPVLWVGRRFPFVKGRWLPAMGVHLPASILFSLAWMALRAAIEERQSRHELFPTTFGDAFSHALVALFAITLLIYWGILLAQNAFAYYEKFHTNELKTAELETHLAQARLQALQMQLNPHFLFNTLNAISSLMHQDVEAADRMIAHLSDLLRYALESTASQQVPLRQELGFLDRYLLIQQTRFGDRLELCREIDPETLDCPVPNLILQPLVENAIQHGIAPHARHGRIMMRARRQGGRLEIEIEDNGAGLKPGTPSREGVGLANTRARLQELYGSEQELVLANGSGGGLCVRLSVPWQNGTPSDARHDAPSRNADFSPPDHSKA